VSVDGPEPAEQSPRPGPPPAAPADPLRRYHQRLRPWRIGYTIGVVVLVLIALGAVKIAYDHGEISHAALDTAATPAPSVVLSSPGSTLTQAWSTSDHTAIGTPYWGGTLVTYSRHTVTGRDATTGKPMWTYTRTDRVTCTAAQLNGVTVAVFELNGNCDQLTALDSATGERRWTRTLDEDGQPLNGRPSYSVAQYTFMLTTPSVIYAISPDGTASEGNGGLDRWVYSPDGCTINSAVLGSSGALISQNCTAPDCKNRKFCGNGEQLLLRDPTMGAEDDDSKNKGNPDQLKWNLIGNTMRPVSADSVITAAQPGSAKLSVLDVAKGKTLSTLSLQAAVGSTSTAFDVADSELINTGGYTYALPQAGTQIDWFAATRTAATATVTDSSSLSAAIVAVGSDAGIDLLNPDDGTTRRSFSVAPPAAGSRVFAYGTGFIVAGPSTTVYR
jgi:hypothetical protein